MLILLVNLAESLHKIIVGQVKKDKKWDENSKKFNDPNSYSDPSRFTSLPFPSLEKVIPNRFRAEDGKFLYMGRENYNQIRDDILGIAQANFYDLWTSGLP